MSGWLQITAGAALVPWIACLMIRPRSLTALAVILILIQLNWFTRYMGAPQVFNRASLIVIGLLGLRLFADFLMKGKKIKRWKALSPVMWLSIYILSLTIISCSYSGESYLLGFYELRYYMAGFTSCFGLYLYFSKALSIARFKLAMIWVGLLQIPFASAQWLVAGGGAVQTLDSVSGSFSGYGELVACQTLVICIVLFEELTSKKKIIFLNNYLICLFLIVPIILSKSRTATAFIILAISFSWLYSSLKNKSIPALIRQALPVFILTGLSVLLLYQFFWKNQYDIDQLLKPGYIANYYMKDPVSDRQRFLLGADPRMGRFRAIVEATRLVSSDPIHFFIGYGSGATAEASFLGKIGQYFQRYGPLAGLGRNEYSKTIAEFGFLGLGGFVAFFIYLYRKLKDITAATSPETAGLFAIIIFTLSLLSVYAITLSSYFFPFVISFFLASVQTEIDRSSSIFQ